MERCYDSKALGDTVLRVRAPSTCNSVQLLYTNDVVHQYARSIIIILESAHHARLHLLGTSRFSQRVSAPIRLRVRRSTARTFGRNMINIVPSHQCWYLLTNHVCGKRREGYMHHSRSFLRCIQWRYTGAQCWKCRKRCMHCWRNVPRIL